MSCLPRWLYLGTGEGDAMSGFIDALLVVLCFGLVVALCQVAMTLGEEIRRDD